MCIKMSEKDKKKKRLSAKNLLGRTDKNRSKSQTDSPRDLDSGDENSSHSETGSTPRKTSFSSTVLLDELNKLSVPRSHSSSTTTTPSSTMTTTTVAMRSTRNQGDLTDRVTELETQMTMVNQVVLGDRQIFQENNDILKRLEKKGDSCSCKIF